MKTITQNENERKKHVSDCIDIERDILPYKVTLITAGVGSGKNYWIREHVLPNYKCLVITSRRKIVDAELKESRVAYEEGKSVLAKRTISLLDLNEEERHKWLGKAPTTDKNIITTNAHIEKFIKDKYDPDNEKTHLWKYFDFIILDEAHSLVADAGFTEAPFHVLRLLKKAYCELKAGRGRARVIMMTGTPEPITYLFRRKDTSVVHEIDLLNECKDVSPRKCAIVKKKYALDTMEDEYKKGKQILCFVNHISTIPEWIEQLGSRGIPEAEIAVSFSDESRNNEFSGTILRNKRITEASLMDAELIPENIRVLLSTSKNKEGINVRNDNIRTVYTEAHCQSDIKQMAGRVRNGADWVCVIEDASGFYTGDPEAEYYLDRHELKGINEAYKQLETDRERRRLHSVIEKRHEFVCFDYFDQKFALYVEKIKQIENEKADDHRIKTYYDDRWEAEVLGWSYPVQKWYPICVCEEFKDIKEFVDDYLADNQLIGVLLSKEKKNEALRAINELIDKYSESKDIKTYPSSLGRLLKQFGYTHKTVDKNGKETHKTKKGDIFTVIEKK